MNIQRLQDANAEHREETACAWIARLRSDTLNAADRQSFAAWLAKSEANHQAFMHMLDLWEELGALAHLPINDLYPESQPCAIAHKQPSKPLFGTGANDKPRINAWNFIQRLIGGGLVTTGLMAMLWVGNQWLKQRPTEQIYTTGRGETRTIKLEDGSKVHLNVNSSLVVTFNNAERRSQLLRGEGYFEVIKQISRPFTVTAGAANISVLGTRFNVERNADTVRVSVTGGTVAVSAARSASGSGPKSVKLIKNQKVQVLKSDIGEIAKTTEDQAIDWIRGQLVFEQIPLAEALLELNRYLDTPVVAAPNVGSKKLSGTFELTNPDDALSAIATALHLDLDNSDPDLTFLSDRLN